MIEKLYQFLPFAIVMAFIGALLSYNLGEWSFWFDESFTSALISYDYSAVISRTANDVHPPLYYLVLKLWSGVFGVSDLALRSMSVFFMIGALGALYALIRRVTDRWFAPLALLFAGASPFVVRYGQEARMYAFAAFVLSLATLVLFKLMNTKQSRRSARLWVVYGLLIAAALYTHYFTFPIILAHALYVLITDTKLSINKKLTKKKVQTELKKLDIRWLYSTIAAGVLFLPWLPVFYKQATRVNDGFWIEGIGIQSIPDMFGQLLLFRPVYSSADITEKMIALGVTLVGIVALWLVWKNAKREEKGILTLLLGPTVISAVVLFSYSMVPFTSSVFYVRYFASFSVLFYLGVVYAAWISRNKLPRIGLVVLIVGLAISLGSGTKAVMDGYGRDWWIADSGVGALNGVLIDGDVIIADGFWNHYDTRHYLHPQFTVQTLVNGDFTGGEVLLENRDDWIIDSYESIDAPNGYVWFVSGTSDFVRGDVPENWESVQTLFSENDFKVQRFVIND